jgi:hypothetical protein
MLTEFIKENQNKLNQTELKVLSYGIKCLNLDTKHAQRCLKGSFYHDDESYIDRILSAGEALEVTTRRNSPERECGDMLVLLWGFLMPDYELIDREKTLPSGKRLDILAKNKDTKNLCVIELKHAKKIDELKARKQVFGYAKELERMYGKTVEAFAITQCGYSDEGMDNLAWYELGIDRMYATAPTSFNHDQLMSICFDLNIKPRKTDTGKMYHYDVLKMYINEYHTE